MESKVILLVIIGTIGVMLMAFSVVFFVLLYRRRVLENELEIQEVKTKHQTEMLNATLKSQEAERNRLGTELHDGVGAMLSTIKLNLEVAKRKGDIQTLGPVLGHLDDTISQVRGISHQMMPIILDKYGLKRAVEDLFDKVSGDSLSIIITQWNTEEELDRQNSLMLFRIVQELLNNTIKHADATEVEFSLAKAGSQLKIQYADNGKGFPSEVLENSQGMGLLNIKNRAQAINASVSFENKNEGGAKVNLVIDRSID
ncbi:sensor histidine kinase [Ekhidna sp.]|uniref:sensor histidine kinase n=1 Tax=Ekhidna sp. TaxID=2608089 RepID=UPI0035131D49